jgi:hypothetical protein
VPAFRTSLPAADHIVDASSYPSDDHASRPVAERVCHQRNSDSCCHAHG